MRPHRENLELDRNAREISREGAMVHALSLEVTGPQSWKRTHIIIGLCYASNSCLANIKALF